MELTGILSSNQYRIVREIRAKGKFSKVWLGECTESKQPFVIKELNQKVALPPAEIGIAVEHPAICKAIDYAIQHEVCYLIIPYIESSDSKFYFSKRNKQVNEMLQAFRSMIQAMVALRKAGWLHLDIKPDNILISHKQQLNAVLIDYGMALPLSQLPERMPFSLAYAAPERILQLNHMVDIHSDIYSLVLCLYEWLTGNLPHYHEHPEFMMQLRITQPLERNKRIPDKLYEVLHGLTTPPAIKRPVRMYNHEALVEIVQASIDTRLHYLQQVI